MKFPANSMGVSTCLAVVDVGICKVVIKANNAHKR